MPMHSYCIFKAIFHFLKIIWEPITVSDNEIEFKMILVTILCFHVSAMDITSFVQLNMLLFHSRRYQQKMQQQHTLHNSNI